MSKEEIKNDICEALAELHEEYILYLRDKYTNYSYEWEDYNNMSAFFKWIIEKKNNIK